MTFSVLIVKLSLHYRLLNKIKFCTSVEKRCLRDGPAPDIYAMVR